MVATLTGAALLASQLAALPDLVGRELTDAELAALPALLDARNDVAIAALLSVARVKHGPTQIGPGTIVAVLDEAGGALLDDLQALGQTDRVVYWAMNPINRGAFDLSVPAARASLVNLKAKMPSHAASIDTHRHDPEDRVGAGSNPVRPSLGRA